MYVSTQVVPGVTRGCRRPSNSECICPYPYRGVVLMLVAEADACRTKWPCWAHLFALALAEVRRGIIEGNTGLPREQQVYGPWSPPFL